MNRFGPLIVLVFPLLLLASGFAVATDDSKVKAAPRRGRIRSVALPWRRVDLGLERRR
jgi:hypothetical protein